MRLLSYFPVEPATGARTQVEQISVEELKAKLDRGDSFRLVMTLGEWAFKSQHIPGSINISKPEQAADQLSPDDEIVVYCTNPPCVASQKAYQQLKAAGYERVKRFSGGLEAWSDAGYPLEGEDAG